MRKGGGGGANDRREKRQGVSVSRDRKKIDDTVPPRKIELDHLTRFWRAPSAAWKISKISPRKGRRVFPAGFRRREFLRGGREKNVGSTRARATPRGHGRARDDEDAREGRLRDARPGRVERSRRFSRLDGAAVGANAARSNGSRTTRLTRTRSLSREKRTSAGSGDSGAPRPRPGRRGARRVRAVATRTHPRNTSPETPPACSTSGCRGTRSRRGVPPPPRATGSSPRWRSRSIASNTTRPSRRPCGTRRG